MTAVQTCRHLAPFESISQSAVADALLVMPLCSSSFFCIILKLELDF